MKRPISKTTDADLRDKMGQLAMTIADDLLAGDATLADRIDGLKTLTDFYGKVSKVDGDGVKSRAGRWGELAERVGGGNGHAEADEA